jgi:hypothetical protein
VSRTTSRGEGFDKNNVRSEVFGENKLLGRGLVSRTTSRGEGFDKNNVRSEVFGENKLLGRGLVSRTSTAGRGVSLRWYKWGTMMEEALKLLCSRESSK